MSKLREQSIAELTRPLRKAARKVGLEGDNQVNLSVTDTGFVAVLTRPLTESDQESLSDGILIGLVMSQQSGNVSVMQLHVKGPSFAELTPSLTDMDGIAVPRDQAQAYMTPTEPPPPDVQVLGGGALPTIALAGAGLFFVLVIVITIVVVTYIIVSKAIEAIEGGDSEGGDGEEEEGT